MAQKKPEDVYQDLYGSEYLSPDDLKPGQKVEATFTSYEVRELFCKGKKNYRCTMTAENRKKRVCINKTSAKAMARAWGKDFSNWLNKPVTIMRSEVNRKQAIIVTPKGEEIQGDDE